MRNRPALLGWLPASLLAALPVACAEAPAGLEQDQGQLPPAFEQILPRGRIAAIDEPVFVRASEADLPDDAWVLGLEWGGEARAYSLNLLNRHEVVNDRVGGRPLAAVW